jgi:hypothetical protein
MGTKRVRYKYKKIYIGELMHSTFRSTEGNGRDFYNFFLVSPKKKKKKKNKKKKKKKIDSSTTINKTTDEKAK